MGTVPIQLSTSRGILAGNDHSRCACVKRPALAPEHLSWGRVDRGTVAFGAGVTGICIAVGAGVSLVLPEEPSGKAVLIGAFVACAVVAFGPIVILGRGAAREPIVYYPIIAFLDLAGGSLAWLGKPETPMSLARADVTKALLLVAAGFVALWAGWFAARGRRSPHARRPLNSDDLPSRRLTIILASTGLVSVVPLVAAGSFGYVGYSDSSGSLGPWTAWVLAAQSALDVAVAFAAFRAFGTSNRTRARPDLYLLVALLILEFGVGLVSGIKTFILPRLLVVVFIYALFHYRVPIKWALVIVIAFGLTFPLVEQYRALSLRHESGWSTPGSNAISRVRTQAKVGVASAQLTYQDDVRLAYEYLTLPRPTATYAASAWVYIPSSWNGGRLYLTDNATFGGSTVVLRTYSDMALRDQWQEIMLSFTAASDLAGLLLIQTTALPTAGSKVYLDALKVSKENGLSSIRVSGFESPSFNAGKSNGFELAVKGVIATARHPEHSAEMAFDKVNRRTRQIENVAVIVRDTPDVFPYARGRDLPAALATAFVPRVLWPGKPKMDFPTKFARRYLKVESGTGPSHLGDLYRNFGFLGVILGMGAFGVAFAFLGRWAEHESLRATLIIAFTLAVMTRIEESLGDTMVIFAHVMAPVFLAALLLPRRRYGIARTRA